VIHLFVQLECVRREVAWRKHQYPRLIAEHRMTVKKAAHEIEAMEAVRATLEALVGQLEGRKAAE
jgi:predicted transcriptional regulator